MRKFRFFLDFEKEERWLNKMARQGYELVGASVGYKFQTAKPENAVIKLDYRTFKKQADFQDYCALFEDSGWKHIAGTNSSGVQYFKKVGERADEDIFSDVDSKAARYKRMSRMYTSLTLSYFPIFVVFMFSDSMDLFAFLNPKSLYYTPGLWEKTGVSFWWSFLFETPFAFFRGFSWLIILVVFSLPLFFALKAEWQYRKRKANNSI